MIPRALAVADGTPQVIYVGAQSSDPAQQGVWRCQLGSPPPLLLLPGSPPKAVLIVGPIDAPANVATQAAIEDMQGDWTYYLNYLFSQPSHTLGTAYQTWPGFSPAALRSYQHNQFPAEFLWLDPSLDGNGQVQGWWSAFAGDPEATVTLTTTTDLKYFYVPLLLR